MGRYGAGKTSLSVLLMARLLAEKRVSRIVSNIPLSFGNPISKDDILNIVLEKAPMLNTGILLDEAWIYIEDRQSVSDYGGFIRKFNHYLALPSVFPIHPRFSFFYVQRIFNGYTIGFPIWVYRWTINNRGVKENGTFGVYNPHAVFGHYPSDFVPGDDAHISDAVSLTAKISGFKGTRRAQKKGTKGDDFDNEFTGSLGKDIEALEDVGTELQEAREDIAKMVKTIKRANR
jgi:hypothetical protein